ncbi:MAG: hypothetical protein AAFN51_05075 [Pseudomonadota bacterium]
MARIVIRDLDQSAELRDTDLDAVVGGANAKNAPSVKVEDLLPQNVFPPLGAGTLGL